MLNWIKKQGVAAYILCGAAILSLVAMIIYIANSTTGYLAGTQMNALPVVFTVITLLALAVLVAFSDKLNDWIVSAIYLAVAVLLSVCVALFIAGRTDVAGDQWFIPGLDTAEKGDCLNGAIVGVAFYVLTIVAVIVAAFFKKLTKEQ